MSYLNPLKVLVQYRGFMEPYGPIYERKYTITHSDLTAELYVFIAKNYAEDQVTSMHDEVRIAWQQDGDNLILAGYVTVDGKDIIGSPKVRNMIFYNEMPTALQALRQADRFLFDENPIFDNTLVFIKFVSENPDYAKTYNFGPIGNY